MIRFAPCKINLGLHVLSRRSDGYHDIETCFYPVPWHDALEIIQSSGAGGQFSLSGIDVPGGTEENLVLKAYRLLSADFNPSGVNIHLHKSIPTGAGLGGGSSDAASALILLNRIFNLELSDDKLESYAARLGSDCAFFIKSKPMIGRERGNVLEDAAINLGGKFLVIVKPSVNVSTAAAYSQLKPAKKYDDIRTIIEQVDISDWREALHNDFEETVFALHPEIADIKNSLYKQGAVYASMSGSGSAVFGLFDEAIDAQSFKNCTVWSGVL